MTHIIYSKCDRIIKERRIYTQSQWWGLYKKVNGE